MCPLVQKVLSSALPRPGYFSSIILCLKCHLLWRTLPDRQSQLKIKERPPAPVITSSGAWKWWECCVLTKPPLLLLWALGWRTVPGVPCTGRSWHGAMDTGMRQVWWIPLQAGSLDPPPLVPAPVAGQRQRTPRPSGIMEATGWKESESQMNVWKKTSFNLHGIVMWARNKRLFY